jgi:2-polyprenyl-6-methoxyphenol hydroxylase-like FAD-dependent oxidoreductase
MRRVAVVGGSIAGLSTGIALSCIGCEVDVYEASPEFLRGRGGGLVVQHEMLEWMMTHGIATLAALTLPGLERQVLDRDGHVLQRFPDATPFTSWEAVYHQLRVAFPAERYHLVSQCVHIHPSPHAVTLTLANGTSITTDLVIGADGVGSLVRAQVAPAARPVYAGYVAWRGVMAEAATPAQVVERLASRFTLFQGRDFHILAYMIPGEDGALAPGHRRLNWVWYWNTEEDTELPDILTDADGHPHRSSVAAGKVQTRHVAALRDRADTVLPSVLAELVQVTPHPFVQVIFDLLCEKMFRDRLVLVGDSASLVRPHTAAGTSKASGDAVALAQHLLAEDFALAHALPRWENERRALAMRLVQHGLRLARSSGLGR